MYSEEKMIIHHMKTGDLFILKVPCWSFLKKTDDSTDEYYKKKKVKNVFIEVDAIIMYLGIENILIEEKIYNFYKFLINEKVNFINIDDFNKLFQGKFVKYLNN